MKNSMKSILGIAIIASALLSCGEDEPTPLCEERNTGSLIVTNNYPESPNSHNSLAVFINRDARSSNSSGDLNIGPGEVGLVTLPAGIHSVNIYLNTGSCSGTRCEVSRDFIDEREVDLEQCEDLNMAFGI
ncbi:hypothetical protein [Ekhidna sp.]|uniref:hypothetical protein n=1 Tax=Ekhidna sp. TaxID=2608089 RepID=UPI003296FB36